MAVADLLPSSIGAIVFGHSLGVFLGIAAEQQINEYVHTMSIASEQYYAQCTMSLGTINS